MAKKEYKNILESLRISLKFLETQSYETVDNATLDLEGVDNHFGIVGSEEENDKAKTILGGYIKKLESQEEKLEQTLGNLNFQKRSSLEQKKLIKYSLFALMIHQGNANSGHYYILIYSEEQRKWRKYSDKIVEEISEK